jgi:hypothetical protein
MIYLSSEQSNMHQKMQNKNGQQPKYRNIFSTREKEEKSFKIKRMPKA